jgi:DNA polymerase III subunit beta
LNITTKRDDILRALRHTAPITAKRSTLPILGCILIQPIGTDGDANTDTNTDANIESITITGYDLATAVTATINCVNVENAHAFTLPGTKLLEITKSSTADDITFSENENKPGKITVSAGTSTFTLQSISADDFPAVPTPNGVLQNDIPSAAIESAIVKTTYATANNPTRNAMCGILIQPRGNQTRFVAIDGHRGSIYTIPHEIKSGRESQIILPSDGAETIRSLITKHKTDTDNTTTIAVDGTFLFITHNGISCSVRLLDVNYPDYERAIPPAGTGEIATFNRNAMLASLRRVSLMAQNESGGITLEILPEEIQLSTDGELGAAHDAIPATFSAVVRKLILNPKYMIDALESLDSEEVVAEMFEGARPIILTPKSIVSDSNQINNGNKNNMLPERFCIVMPMNK